MKFYTFHQSNPGGHTIAEMPRELIIEASSAKEANDKAEKLGVYFDGILSGRDCECCNDRWYRVDEYDAKDVPSIYNEPCKLYGDDIPGIVIHFADGRVQNARDGKTKLERTLK